LKTLRLNFNIKDAKASGDEEAKALAEALKTNKRLKILELMNNNIGDEGAKALAEALRENTTLKILELKFNYKIGPEGKTALDAVNALKKGVILRIKNKRSPKKSLGREKSTKKSLGRKKGTKKSLGRKKSTKKSLGRKRQQDKK
jgi:ABC-type protease/lipase transport system fused ATPase/permease subunit